ncbi:MAG: zinc-dependent alcohol dehydrogenase family protein [Pseudomonadota bacterium]
MALIKVNSLCEEVPIKAVAYEINGAPWDVAKVIDLPEPALSAGEVLVQLEAAPIHIADLLAMRADMPFFPLPPGVGGFEGVGRIIEVGQDVDDWEVGSRVFLPIGYGAWQERRSVPAAQLMRAPEGIAAAQLALVPINLATAYLLLHAYDPLAPGDWVVQNAANSNVAGYVHRFAERAGIKMIHIVRRPELVDVLTADGRAHVLVDGPELRAQVQEISGAAPKIALDAVGGEATGRLGSCVADHGLVLSYGFLSKQPHQIAYPDLMFRGVRLRGVLTNWAMERIGPDGLEKMYREMDAVMADGQLAADIAGVYPFSQAADALRHAAKTGPERTGKVILVPDDASHV